MRNQGQFIKAIIRHPNRWATLVGLVCLPVAGWNALMRLIALFADPASQPAFRAEHRIFWGTADALWLVMLSLGLVWFIATFARHYPRRV